MGCEGESDAWRSLNDMSRVFLPMRGATASGGEPLLQVSDLVCFSSGQGKNVEFSRRHIFILLSASHE
jgi:hypothetical protein